MEEGQKKGLTIEQACKTVGVTSRTFLNWRKAPSGDGRLDRRNFVSPRRIANEERKRIARKYGLSEKQVINMIPDSNGTWQMPSEEGDKPKEKDIYELNDDMEDL